MFSAILKDLDLTPEQIDIYESLLEHGSQSASELASSTKVKRTYVYNVCGELMKLGLISQGLRGKTTVFHAETPDKLVKLAEVQKEQAEQAQKALETILPTLASKYTLAENKPVVTYYEGVEGIKKVYLDTLTEGQPILALVETSKVNQAIYDWVTTEYIAKRIEAKIKVQAIVASGPKTEKYTRLDEAQLRETKTIASAKYPFEHEINIYGPKVALISHKRDAKLVGIIINNPVIANTFRSWFKLTWDLLEE